MSDHQIVTKLNEGHEMIIGISGSAGAGKSEVAKILVRDYECELHKFASPLKKMLKAIGLTDDDIEGELKEAPNLLLDGKTPRYAMQTLGTEWGRELIGQDLWIRLWLNATVGIDHVVTDDVRFENELKAVQRGNGKVVLIVGREETKVPAHVSETGLPRYTFDHIIYNDGSLLDLENKVERMMNELDFRV